VKRRSQDCAPAEAVANAAVVISTYNRPKALDLVLQGLSRQRVKAQQIVVGDDGSTAETREVIKSWKERGLPVEHCWHEDRGYRKSVIMNQAVRAVTQPLCIFTDGDCVPLEGFVRDHVRYAEPGFIPAGPRMLADPALTKSLESGTETCLGRSIFWWMEQRLRSRVNRLLPLMHLPDGAWRKSSPRKWEWVRGCNFSVETKHVWRVGGFEENLFGWGPDDSDIAVRMINSGVKVKSLRFAAPVLHLWHKEESRVTLEQNLAYLHAALAEKRTRASAGFTDEEIATRGIAACAR
jgi:glycosyltransferase involved in cell wall biosynthesis